MLTPLKKPILDTSEKCLLSKMMREIIAELNYYPLIIPLIEDYNATKGIESRGPILAELLSENMSWKSFLKLLDVLQLNEVTFTVNVKKLNKEVSSSIKPYSMEMLEAKYKKIKEKNHEANKNN